MDSARVAAQEAKVRASFGLAREVEVQALVLRRLGFRSGGKILGQRPMTPEDFSDTIHQQPETLAQRLHGHSSFDSCCLPLLKALSPQHSWPSVLWECQNRTCDITCVPTLELCAAICTRILCCASRLQKAKTASWLVVIGVGDDTALLQACVALHLGTVLRQAVDLTSKRVVLRLDDDDFRIEFLAVGEPARPEAPVSAMPLKDVGLAHLSFCSPGKKVYILADGLKISLDDAWIAKEDGTPRENLEEACTVNMPASMLESTRSYSTDAEDHPKTPTPFRLTELFPKTLSEQDFLGRGFKEPDPEAGLFHTHLFVKTRRKATLPFLAPQLCHGKGPYDLRMKADRALLGVHKLKDASLVMSLNNAEDLRTSLPTEVLEVLKDALYNQVDRKKARYVRGLIAEAAQCCDGRAKKQLSLLLNYSLEMFQNGRDAFSLLRR